MFDCNNTIGLINVPLMFCYMISNKCPSMLLLSTYMKGLKEGLDLVLMYALYSCAHVSLLDKATDH